MHDLRWVLESVVFVQGNEQRISESKGEKGRERTKREQRGAKGEGKRKKTKGVSVRGSERMCVCVCFLLGEIFFPPKRHLFWARFFFHPNDICFGRDFFSAQQKKSVRVFFVRGSERWFVWCFFFTGCGFYWMYFFN